jgi:hypothetical protein
MHFEYCAIDHDDSDRHDHALVVEDARNFTSESQVRSITCINVDQSLHSSPL